MSATPGLRADASRNRVLLLDAASAAFAEQGSGVSVGEIARRAGVAKGTVFRHFASKEELLSAIMLRLLDELVRRAESLLDAADPADALGEFMAAGVEALVADRAFCDVVGRPSLQDPAVRREIHHLRDAVEALTVRARDAGLVRADVTGTDVVLLLAGIQHTAAPLLDEEPRAWRRYLQLALDGLSATGAGELPYRPADGAALVG